LKDESPEEFEGYNREFLMRDYVNRDNTTRRYQNYITSITSRLEAMHTDEFQPDLRKAEDLIASLKINN
jgi:C-terminal processing protease CtpA/Prc